MEMSQPQPNKDGNVQLDANVGVEASAEYKDYRFLFMTNKVFSSREEAVNWVREIGKKNNMFFTIATSRPVWTYIGCERGGRYREHKHREGTASRKSSGSKRIHCPFQVKLQKKADDQWVVRIDRDKGKHNHELGLFRKCQSSAKKAKHDDDDEESNRRQSADDRARAVELFEEACRTFKETATTAGMLMAIKTLSELWVPQDLGINEPNEYASTEAFSKIP